MKRAALRLLAIASVAARAAAATRRRGTRGGPEHALKRRASGGIHSADPDPAGMSVDSELGVLDTEDVEATLKRALRRHPRLLPARGQGAALRGRAGDAALPRRRRRHRRRTCWSSSRRWATTTSSAAWSRSGAGSRSTRPPATSRRRSNTRSSSARRNQLAVLDVDGLKLDHDLVGVPAPARRLRAAGRRGRERDHLHRAERLPRLGRAWRPASTLDEDVGDCMVQTIRRWKMSATLPGRVMRATFSIPPVIATAEATPRRTAGHRRPIALMATASFRLRCFRMISGR